MRAPTLASYLALGVGFTLAIALIARRLGRTQPASASLALALLAGAVVIVGDTLTGNWLTRTAAYSPPPLIGARFYGLENSHMGFLVGLSVVGLAALWQWRPTWGGGVAVAAVAVTLLIGAPFWGANWGGCFAAAASFLLLWLLAARRRWSRAIPAALGLLVLAAITPGALDLLVSPSPEHRTHIGAAAALLLSHHGDQLLDIARRKLAAGVGILLYTPWTIVLGLVAAAACWVLLRRGGPVQTALRGQPRMWAGIAAALLGGVVSTVVNDSGVAAGAGLWCAGVGAALYVVARWEAAT